MTSGSFACRALAVMLLAALPVAAETVPLADAVRAAKVREAGLRSIEGSLDVLRRRLTPAATVQERLLAAPQDYADPERGRVRMAAAERDALLQEFRRQLEAFAHNRDTGLPPTWADEVLRSEKQRIDTTIDSLLQNDFDSRYRAARAAAVQVQHEAAARQMAPEPATVLSLAGDLDAFAAVSSEAALDRARQAAARTATAQRLDTARAGSAWLAEVDASLETLAQRATEASLTSLWEQLRTLQQAELPGLVRATDLAVGLQVELERVARATASPHAVYSVVAQRVAARSVALEHAKIGATIGANLTPARGCVALPASAVQEAVGDDLSALPVDLASHLTALMEKLLPATRKRLVREHVANVRDAPARTQFATHVDELLQSDATLTASVQNAFTSCLTPPLVEQRRALARAELAAALPTIADRSFEIDADALAGLLLAEEVDREAFPPPQGLRLEEAHTLYDEHIQALHDEAVAALRVQEGLTRARIARIS